MTVMIIISILAVMLYPTLGWYQERARRVACGENLKGLYTATSAYLNGNGGIWPQIPWSSDDQQTYARQWHDALEPFGMDWSNFICPSVQNKTGNPDYRQQKYNRTDYVGEFFDNKPWTARRWERQPWFIERQDIHGSGNLFIMANGTLIDVNEARKVPNQPLPR